MSYANDKQQQQQYPQQQYQNPQQMQGNQPAYVNAQPGLTNQMSVSPLNSKQIPFGANGQRDWANGLCSLDHCLKAWCCPCCIYQNNEDRLEALRLGQVNSKPSDFGASCLFYCLMLYCGIPCVLTGKQRESVRQRYLISGGLCGDCITSCFCHVCVLSQSASELIDEERALGYNKV